MTIENLRTALEKNHKSVKASTANMDLRAIRRALEAAVVEGHCSKNVAKHVKTLPEDDSLERAPFDADEVRLLIEMAIDEEMKGLITIAAHTGIRLMDILKLSPTNIDQGNIILLPDKTKRQKKVVRVPMSAPVLKWIGDRKGDFFPELRTKSKAVVSMHFSALMKKAGIPKTIVLKGGIQASRSFHCLRHSFTSWLAAADIHSDVRQKLTGHSSAGIHAKYTHHDKTLNRAVETLPSL